MRAMLGTGWPHVTTTD